MVRLIALRTKLFAGRDDADSEDLLPKPIRDDPSRQRVIGIDQPPRQCQSILGSVLRKWMERGGNSLRHFLTEV